MTTPLVHSFIDKTAWGPGPWQSEPDRVQWTDETTGLPCLALCANPHSGNWCGYVAVPPGHPCHRKEYGEMDVDVHGGLTFSDSCSDDPMMVCHVPEPGQPADVWWFGFDCAHFMDLSPARRAWEATIPGFEKYAHLADNDVYRDLDYVKAECQSLATQLAAVAS